MPLQHVTGKIHGHIILYALSTCGWCRMTKKLLNELGIDYYYTDVDQLSGDERSEAAKAIKKWNPEQSLPIMVIDDKKAIVGYQEEAIRASFKI